MNKTKAKTTETTFDKYRKKLEDIDNDLATKYRSKIRLMNLGQLRDIKLCRRLKINRARCLTYQKQLQSLAKIEFSSDQLKLITDRIDKFFNKLKKETNGS